MCNCASGGLLGSMIREDEDHFSFFRFLFHLIYSSFLSVFFFSFFSFMIIHSVILFKPLLILIFSSPPTSVICCWTLSPAVRKSLFF